MGVGTPSPGADRGTKQQGGVVEAVPAMWPFVFPPEMPQAPRPQLEAAVAEPAAFRAARSGIEAPDTPRPSGMLPPAQARTPASSDLGLLVDHAGPARGGDGSAEALQSVPGDPVASQPPQRSEQESRMWEVNDVVDYDILTREVKLGSGSFGEVFRATLHDQKVAVKVFALASEQTGQGAARCQGLTPQELEGFQRLLLEEAKLLGKLHHDNIVGFRGVCLEPPCVIMEYCARGSLDSVFQSARTGNLMLPWWRRVFMMLQTAMGMSYLHNGKLTVIHRDLKSANVLVDASFRCKISDFGMSHVLGEEVVLSTLCGVNPRWLAPELLSPGNPFTKASDVYAFGILMWEALTFKVPFAKETNIHHIATRVREKGRPPVPRNTEELPGGAAEAYVGVGDYIALMKRCWDQAPAERPAFKEIVDTLRALAAATGNEAAAQQQRLRQQQPAGALPP